jgi:hypothetical protein
MRPLVLQSSCGFSARRVALFESTRLLPSVSSECLPKTMSPGWARCRRSCGHVGVSAIVSVAGGLEASHVGGLAKCELKRYQPTRITRPEFRQDLETCRASPGPSEFLRFIIEEGETF